MCSIPAPPPLPTGATSLPNILNESTKHLLDEGTCKWASDLPELRLACQRHKLCLDDEPYKFVYQHFGSLIQAGPTCGLVALSMMLRGEVSLDEIFQLAKAEGYSQSGEMFSCKYMEMLTRKTLSLADLDNVQVTLEKNNLISDFIIKRLLDEAVLLVPYDSDYNNAPCLKKGHRAHWALVCGILISTKKQPLEDSYLSELDNIYLLCKHGKSKHLAIWSLEQLAKSNMNLLEFSPKRGEDNLIYILPEGGVGGENGLRNQFLVIEGI